MIDQKKRCARFLTKVGVAALALPVLAVGLAPTSAAQTTPTFVGDYTAVIKPYVIDPQTGARIGQPDIASIWNVFSTCALSGCAAQVSSGAKVGFTMIWDGTQWGRVAVPATGLCRQGPAPARFAEVSLVPQSDGTLTGTLTSTVDCDGVAKGLPFPLTLTPA